MGCAATTQCSDYGWRPVRLVNGDIADELTVHVQNRACGKQVEPCGLQPLDENMRLYVRGIRQRSPLRLELARLQERYPDKDFSMQKGDEIVAVNGVTTVNGMLRALHWNPKLAITCRRSYEIDNDSVRSPASTFATVSPLGLPPGYASAKSCISTGTHGSARKVRFNSGIDCPAVNNAINSINNVSKWERETSGFSCFEGAFPGMSSPGPVSSTGTLASSSQVSTRSGSSRGTLSL
mmetsp:Transcript_11956/g.27962  ORF Transcript_11956/g.27962 Transcript_11956/m.27962 type:complete len:237 (+) Transcript_11956:99-809(+)